MAIELSPETLARIEETMKATGIESADDVFRFALDAMHDAREATHDEFDTALQVAFDESEAQFERGEGMLMRDVLDKLERKYLKQ